MGEGLAGGENEGMNKRGRRRRRRRRWKLVPNFSLSVLGSSTGTDVVSFINRLDSTTADRKTCSYAICHGTGRSIKIDEA